MKRTLAATLMAVTALSSISAAHAADSTVPDAVVSALATTMPRSALSQQSFYFVMTDRYANGDTSNDNGSRDMAAGLAMGGNIPTDPGYFHGGDFKGLTANLDRIKRMGFTALWITPPFVNRAVQGGSAGYHGYWIVDFTKIDPHLGTEADFRAFMARAHALGLKVYLDIVMNHTADVIQYRDGNGWSATPKTTAYIPTGLANAKSPAWLNDLSNYHNQGDVQDWGNVTQYQNGDFFGLDDIKTENAVVVDGFARTYADWVTKFGIDGFRIDTAKHVDDQFFSRWVPAFLKYANIDPATSGFNMFGEVFDTDPVFVSSFVRQRGLPSVLDFPFQQTLVRFAAGGTKASAILSAEQSDFYYNVGGSPFATNAYSLPVFGGNHDMGRIAYELADAANLDPSNKSDNARLLARVKLATAVMFLMRGAPVVYYGDEVGMIGAGGDKAARQDMFPTNVSDWQTEPRLGSKPIGLGSSLGAAALKLPIAAEITSLNALRARYAALRNGAFIPRSATSGVAAWSKVASTERREYLVVANSDDSARTVTVPVATPRSKFVSIFGPAMSPVATAAGRLKVRIAARSAIVLRAVRLLPTMAAAPVLAATVARDYTLGAIVAAATTKVMDPLTVTFAARSCATCTWSALGSVDAPPYKLVVPSSAWAGGTYLDIVALTRTSDGKVAAGAVAHVAEALAPKA